MFFFLISSVCDALRKGENCMQVFYSENPKERSLLDDLGLDDSIVLKLRSFVVGRMHFRFMCLGIGTKIGIMFTRQ